MIIFSDGSMRVSGINSVNDSAYDEHRVGVAADPWTAMSLVELLELRGYKYVRLRDATYSSGNCFCPVGNFSLDAVKAELRIAMAREEKEELEAERTDEISLEDLEFEDRMREWDADDDEAAAERAADEKAPDRY